MYLRILVPTDGSAISWRALQEAVLLTGERVLARATEKLRQSGMAAETALLEAKGRHIAGVIVEESRQ